MRPLLLLLLLTACPGTDDPTGITDACRIVDEGMGCPECADGDVTCSLDGLERTEMSCGGCQARASLIAALCDAGSQVTEAEIDDDMVCVPAE